MITEVKDRVRAAANLREAKVFARECGESVEAWFQNPDVKDDPEWQEAYALHLEQTTSKR